MVGLPEGYGYYRTESTDLLRSVKRQPLRSDTLVESSPTIESLLDQLISSQYQDAPPWMKAAALTAKYRPSNFVRESAKRSFDYQTSSELLQGEADDSQLQIACEDIQVQVDCLMDLLPALEQIDEQLVKSAPAVSNNELQSGIRHKDSAEGYSAVINPVSPSTSAENHIPGVIVTPSEHKVPVERTALDPQPRSSAAWSQQDDELLMQLRAEGLNWGPISTHFPSKTANGCRKRHERLMEKKSAESWGGIKIEALGEAYLKCREAVWKILADATGLNWQLLESVVSVIVRLM